MTWPSTGPPEDQAADLFRAMVARTPIVLGVTADGTTGWASPSAVRIFGIRPHTDLRDLVDGRIHPDDRERAHRHLVDPVAPGPTQLRLRDQDGRWRTISFVAADLRADPAVGGIIHYGTDITAARAADEP